jgi:hypothetical protein
VVARGGRLEHPLPVRPPVHPGARLIRPDDGTGAHLLPDRGRLRSQPPRHPRQRVHDRPLAHPQLPQVPAERRQPRIADVVLLMEIGPQRFQPRAEHPRGLEARRVLGSGRRPAVGTGRGVAPRFEHDRLHRGQLHHLAVPHPHLRAVHQVVPTRRTVRRLAEHHPVGLHPPSTRSRVSDRPPALRPFGRGGRPLALPALARWSRGVLRCLRCPPAPRQLRFQLGNPRLRGRQLRFELPHHADQVRQAQLGQFVIRHARIVPCGLPGCQAEPSGSPSRRVGIQVPFV